MGNLIQQSYELPSMNGDWGALYATYNLAGDLTDLGYPDGSHIQQAFDNAGHLCNLMNATGGAITCGTNTSYSYFSSPTYLPSGALGAATLGNGTVESYSLNNRLQPTEISVKNANGVYYMDKKYCYDPTVANCFTSSATNNNGNISVVLNALNPSRSQGYSYDSLNRISAFSNSDQSMSQSFNVDSFGNMKVTGGTLLSNVTFDTQNPVPHNRIDVSTNAGYDYDAAGNLTLAPLPISGTQQYNYEADSKLVSLGDPASPSAKYTYDANGVRVRKEASGNWTEYLSFGGMPIAEKNSSGGWSDYIFANGQRIARVDPTQTIDVRFTNDSWVETDRNLYINSVTVGSTVIPLTDPSVSYVGGPCNGYYDNSHVILFCNGDVIISNVPAGAPITVNAWGTPDMGVYPHMQVFLNGNLAGEFDTTGQPQDYTTYPVHYYSADHLGTTTVVTNGQGALQNDSDYWSARCFVPVGLLV
jgi:hypothetical protein